MHDTIVSMASTAIISCFMLLDCRLSIIYITWREVDESLLFISVSCKEFLVMPVYASAVSRRGNSSCLSIYRYIASRDIPSVVESTHL